MESRQSLPKLISVIVPVLDEAESLGQLAEELRAVAETHRLPIEVIFVDDGSRDDSWEKILRLTAEDVRVNGIRFRRNFGKAAALAAGFDAASGEIVIQMDADLQDDPAEVPVPKPFVISWKTRHHRPVRKCDRWTTSGTINLQCENSVRITPNERQLFLGSLQSEVVG